MTRLLLYMLAFSLASSAYAGTAVVFPDYEKFKDSGGHDFLVESSVPGAFKTPEGVVAAMLVLGEQVKNKELTAPFNPDVLKGSSAFEGALPLASYFRGARIKGRTFIVSFSEGAMRYLSSTAAIQQVVKGAIEGTLRKNFPKIEAVKYEIDGKIVDAWDA